MLGQCLLEGVWVEGLEVEGLEGFVADEPDEPDEPEGLVALEELEDELEGFDAALATAIPSPRLSPSDPAATATPRRGRLSFMCCSFR